MDINNNEKAVQRINEELGKIKNKINHIYFFVIDTEGYASGSLEYIYHLAKFTKDAGYNVAMLYQTEPVAKGQEKNEFVGVAQWLGQEYADIPHYDIQDGDVEISASDVLFIPDIYSQVMNQTKSLPCKRIAIMQNYDYILAQMPYSAQWGDYGITEAICNTEENEKLLKGIFPYVKTTVIEPFIDKIFGETDEPKKMVINVISHNPDDVTRLVKPFYWKYPLMKWVSFRDLRGFSKEKFATDLRESFLTIWMDDPASFGYSALEAMKSGNVVFAKVPQNAKKWMTNNAKYQGGFNDSCIWFDKIEDMHDKIATMVRGFITDTIPANLQDGHKDALSLYDEGKTKTYMLAFIEKVLDERAKAFEELIKIGEKSEEK